MSVPPAPMALSLFLLPLLDSSVTVDNAHHHDNLCRNDFFEKLSLYYFFFYVVNVQTTT